MNTMMFKQVIAIVLVTILGLVSAQDIAPSACSTGCVNGVFANAPNLGCASGDSVCVCNKSDFFYDGIRDCITQACTADGPDSQIPLAEAYGDSICAGLGASSQPLPAPTSSAVPESPGPESTVTGEAPATTTVADSTTTSVSSAEFSSQSTVASTTAASQESTASESVTEPTIAPVSPSATSTSTSTSSSTASGSSQPTSTSSTSEATAGLSTAVKAGIGAGVGAAVLAALIIAVCVCLRRRQRNKTANRVRNYKISEPMAIPDRQFRNDVGRAEAGLPKPIITTLPVHADSTAVATSPTSLYSNSSELETHARRYEDMMPRTQPRTMI